MKTKQRKLDHIRICLEEDVESRVGSGFEDITLIHRALPEIDFSKIDTNVEFLGKKLKYPIVIAAMTGGHEEAYEINKNLAIAAQKLGIAIGVGSQRAAIEDEKLAYTYSVVREQAPDAFVIANLGVVQFCKGYGVKEAEKAIEMVEADALALHLNALQEAVQKEGDLNFEGCLKAIEKLSSELSVPVIVKETGAGIAREEAKKIAEAGASAIDVGGLGGTSFSAVESYRQGNHAETFWDWGIPTAISVMECSSLSIPIIATGGIRSGIDCAKAIALGASLCGIALPLLKPATKSAKAVEEKLIQIVGELKTAMFLTGSADLNALKKAELVITGKTREWIQQREKAWK